MYNAVTFHPVTVTAETLQVLARQPHNDKLLALYMAYVEISTWQHTNNVRATTEFMARRLGWSERAIAGYKRELINLNLVEDIRRTDAQGKVVGYYILVKHIVNPGGGFGEGVDDVTPSTNNSQGSTNNYKGSALVSCNEALDSSDIPTTEGAPTQHGSTVVNPSEPQPAVASSSNQTAKADPKARGSAKGIGYLDDLSPSEVKAIGEKFRLEERTIIQEAEKAADYARQVGVARYKDYPSFFRNWLRRGLESGKLALLPEKTADELAYEEYVRGLTRG